MHGSVFDQEMRRECDGGQVDSGLGVEGARNSSGNAVCLDVVEEDDLEHAHRDFALRPPRRYIDIEVQATIEPERLIDWRRHATTHVD